MESDGGSKTKHSTLDKLKLLKNLKAFKYMRI